LENKVGCSISEEEFQQYVHGRSSDATLSYFLNKQLTENEIMELEEEKEKIYRSLCLGNPEFKLADGLTDFLDVLVEKNVPITIATASALTNVKFFFEHLHMDKWFSLDKVAYNDGIISGKPEPDLYLRAAEKINIDMNECIVFEDAKSGIEAAQRAKVHKVIGVASMMSSEQLLELGVTATICDYTNISDILKLLSE